jgi:hypothetical protein
MVDHLSSLEESQEISFEGTMIRIVNSWVIVPNRLSKKRLWIGLFPNWSSKKEIGKEKYQLGLISDHHTKVFHVAKKCFPNER